MLISAGQYNRDFSISERLFTYGLEELYSKLYDYQLRFSVQAPGGDEGVAYVRVTLNAPPTKGNCSVNPLSGKADTKFNISCSGFDDDDGIKFYQFYC